MDGTCRKISDIFSTVPAEEHLRFLHLNNILVDCNTYRKSRHIVKRKPVVANIKGGLAMIFKSCKFLLGLVHETERHEKQVGRHTYGAVTISVPLGEREKI